MTTVINLLYKVTISWFQMAENKVHLSEDEWAEMNSARSGREAGVGGTGGVVMEGETRMKGEQGEWVNN